jgi:hypothetical protein
VLGLALELVCGFALAVAIHRLVIGVAQRRADEGEHRKDSTGAYV